MAKRKFLRRIWSRYSKLGKRRKKKQVWRRPKGRDNKMREKRKGYPSVVRIGYQKNKKEKGLIQGKRPIMIFNVMELERVGKGDIVVLGRVGKKKKTEIIKTAKEKKIEICNINIEKFLKKLNEKKEKK